MMKDEFRDLVFAYRSVFGSDLGKRVLADLRKVCGPDRSVVDSDPHLTYFNEGKRVVYIYIQNLLDIDDIETYMKKFEPYAVFEGGEDESSTKEAN